CWGLGIRDWGLGINPQSLKDPHDKRQHDESRARRGSLASLGPHEETLGGDRRHGVSQHHRSAAPRRKDRAAGFRQLPFAQARAQERTESEDRGQGGRAAEEGPVLQARQGTQGIDQQGAHSADAIGAVRPDGGVATERLWSPWRLAYVTVANGESAACVFCNTDDPARDALVLSRGRSCYIVLNLYPYNSGHLMVVPYRHVGSL